MTKWRYQKKICLHNNTNFIKAIIYDKEKKILKNLVMIMNFGYTKSRNRNGRGDLYESGTTTIRLSQRN